MLGLALIVVSVVRALEKPIVAVAGLVVTTFPPLTAPTSMLPPFTCTRIRPSAAVAMIGEAVSASKDRLSELPVCSTAMRSVSIRPVLNDSPMFSVAVAVPLACIVPFSTSVALSTVVSML